MGVGAYCTVKYFLFLLILSITCSRFNCQTANATVCRSQGACPPESGDLAIGRGDQLVANSTCGLNGSEEYCIDSFPRDICRTCDANVPNQYHPPSKMALPYSVASPNQTWWQSANAERVVTIELNLEARFYFTHVILTFKSRLPGAMILEKSNNFGETYQIYKYFADDCLRRFGVPERIRSINLHDVLCVKVSNEKTLGELVYRVLPPNIMISRNDRYSQENIDRISITNLRLTLFDFQNTMLDGVDIVEDFPKYYYYSIYSLVVRGWCFCYGHASNCDPLEGAPQLPGMVNAICRCNHNTMGLNCEECLPLFNDRPWEPANLVTGEANQCKMCQCYGHAVSCHYDDSVGGGVCDNCTHDTTGNNCELCEEFYYRNTSKLLNDPEICIRCTCDPAGSLNKGACIQDDMPLKSLLAGQCLCKDNVDDSSENTNCDTCLPGYFNLTATNPQGCEECGCDPKGSTGTECDQVTGQCPCKEGVTGLHCDMCKIGSCCLSGQNPEGCEPCNCNEGGSKSLLCNPTTGQCDCKENIKGLKCDEIPDEFYVEINVTVEVENVPTIDPTDIIINGTFPEDPYVVIVKENETIEITIDDLPPGVHTPVIVFIIPENTSSDGDIIIFVNIVFPNGTTFPNDSNCELNEDGNITVPLSEAVYSSSTGTYLVALPTLCTAVNTTVDIDIEVDTGDGDGPTVILIDKIDFVPVIPPSINITIPTIDIDCSDEINIPYCNFYNVNITVGANISVSCDDPLAPPTVKLDPRCIEVIITVTTGAKPCNCDITGSFNKTCEKLGGQCPCKPGVTGRTCDKCLPHHFNFTSEGCTECSCNEDGSRHGQCDLDDGQCVCLPGVRGVMCVECEEDHFSFGSPGGCIPCDCNTTGALSDRCDEDGVCTCRPAITGEKCDRCLSDHWGFDEDGCLPCDCDRGGSTPAATCDVESGQCECREGVAGRRCDTCESSPLGPGPKIEDFCIDCFCNGFSDTCFPDEGWFQGSVAYTFRDQDEILGWSSTFGNISWKSDALLSWLPSDSSGSSVLDINFPESFLGDKRTAYGHYLVFTAVLRVDGNYSASVANLKLVLNSQLNKYTFISLEQELEPISESISSYVIPLREGDFTKSGFIPKEASYDDVRRVLANLMTLQLHIEFLSDSSEHFIEIYQVHLDYAVNSPSHPYVDTPLTPVNFVEECECDVSRTGIYCQSCAEGYTRDPQFGGQFAACVKCFCFGYSNSCHPESNICYNCTGFTTGDFCEDCISGYYRNYTSNTCEPCLCYGGPDAPNQFTDECHMTETNEVHCECPEGFIGSDCGKCAPGFFGVPSQPEGGCGRCSCHGNTVSIGPACNTVNGVCNCIEPYVGDNCELCKDGYYGDATKQDCKECNCSFLGTVSNTFCDRFSGQCDCRENVTSLSCDECIPGTYGLTTLGVCRSCDCCTQGATSTNCTAQDGYCNCITGYTGRDCCDCEDGYYKFEGFCIPCSCPNISSLSTICDKDTGKCPCKEGVTGNKCDTCLLDTSGLLPECEPCDECFERWNDRIGSFMKDVHIAVEFTEVLNITIVPLADLFSLISQIEDTIANSSLNATEYTSTDEILTDLNMTLTHLLSLAMDHYQNLTESNSSNEELFTLVVTLNTSLTFLVGELAGLNRSYPLADCDPLWQLVVEGRNRSNEAEVIKAQATILSSNMTLFIDNYNDKRGRSTFEERRKSLQQRITDLQILFNDITAHLGDVTKELCGNYGDECLVCGGSRVESQGCGFCSSNYTVCSGLYANATLASESARKARELGEELKLNISNAKMILDMLKNDIIALGVTGNITLDRIRIIIMNIERTFLLTIDVHIKMDEVELYLMNNLPEEIAKLELETLSYVLSKTPEQVLQLLEELNMTLNSFPEWQNASNDDLGIEANGIFSTANNANSIAFKVTNRANVVRNDIKAFNEMASETESNVSMSEERTAEANQNSNQTSILLDNIEQDLRETEMILDLLEPDLEEAEALCKENTIHLQAVHKRTSQTEELAKEAKTKSDKMQREFGELRTDSEEKLDETTEQLRVTEGMKVQVEALKEKGLVQLSHIKGIIQQQKSIREMQQKIRDDIQSIKIVIEQLALEINQNNNRNTACLLTGGPGK